MAGDLTGLGTRRNVVVLGLNDRVEIFHFAGHEIILREKDGEIFAQRFNRHRQPEAPARKL